MTGLDVKNLRRLFGLSRKALARMVREPRYAIKFWEDFGEDKIYDSERAEVVLDALLENLKRFETLPETLQPTLFSNTHAPVHARYGVLLAAARKSAECGQRLERPQCGARTRAGGRCKAPAVRGKARCRMHGGLSSGPRTKEGRARIAEAQRRRWQTIREGGRGVK